MVSIVTDKRHTGADPHATLGARSNQFFWKNNGSNNHEATLKMLYSARNAVSRAETSKPASLPPPPASSGKVF